METARTRNNRLAPVTLAQDVAGVLSYVDDQVKLGVKGPQLSQWAQSHQLSLPGKLYDVSKVGDRGVLARVGGEEIILECPQGDPILSEFEHALAEPSAGVYRIEQQSVTIELRGPKANRILAQTCGIDFSAEPALRMIYTRVAAASCGIIPLGDVYRIWIDYTLAPYLWEAFTEIARETPDQ